MSANFGPNEDDLMVTWLQAMSGTQNDFKEPILDENSVRLVKTFCNGFEQNVHVLALSLEILEEYLRRKTSDFDNHLMIVGAAVLLATKLVGEQSSSSKHVAWLIKQFPVDGCSLNVIMRKEMELCVSLNFKLPSCTVVDDLDLVVEAVSRHRGLQVPLTELCRNLLELVLFVKREWFETMEMLYGCTVKSRLIFQLLVRNRFYLPLGILVTALRITAYGTLVEPQDVVGTLMPITKIHWDHINTLYVQLEKLLKKRDV